MRIYENPQKTSENRLNCRSWYIPENCGFTDLNGIWRFAFFENGDTVTEIDAWDNIDVPSCWQARGYENPNYTNTAYPYPCDPPYVPDINPVGVYERAFELNDIKCSYLVFEGVSSHAEIYINGSYVGFTEGSRLLAEFDITPFVKTGENIIRVYVRKWCCGSYLEDQDAFRFNGIFRDVYILSRPEGHIFDLDIKTEDNKIVCIADADFTAEIYESDTFLGSVASVGKRAEFEINCPRPWTAESPNLYTVRLCCAGEIIVRKIGFRTIAISDACELLINGSPVKLKGVNHHDTHPVNGWTMTKEDIVKDLTLMRQLNINTIRTSHYPPSPVFLDYCDEMGFYIILENDLESHGFIRRNANEPWPGYDVEHPEWPCVNPLWEKEFVDRMSRTYERDKIHTSIIMWSTGNESGFGENTRKMLQLLKTRDSMRLTHCEDASSSGNTDAVDVYSRMYSSIADLRKWAEDDDFKQPAFLCEYAHAMGNGPGGIWDYWETIYSSKKLIGGCIWEWADHTVLVDGVQKYGGDFEGELTHEKNFCCDGMVFSDRSLKPGSMEIKNTYAPFRIKWQNGALTVKNLFDFNSFGDYNFEYEITVDGVSLEKKAFKADILPNEEFSIIPNTALPDSCEMGCFISVKMTDINGCEIGTLQEEIPVSIKRPKTAAAGLTLCDNGFTVSAIGDGFEYVISKQTGSFISIKKCGEEQLSAPVKLSYFRPTTDNDRHMKALWDRTTIWQGENLDCVFTKIYSAQVSDNKIIFEASAAGVSRTPFFRYTLSYEFYADSSVEISLVGSIRERTIWLPRLGFEFKVKYENDKFTYFGNGPMQSYCDMSHHGLFGLHRSSADAEYVNYVRPQEHGNHYDCRLLKMDNSLKFTADSMEISVLHNSIEQITAAEHTDELSKSDGTHIRIDYKVSGIGSASCGPQLEERYQLNEKNISFNFTLSLN